MNFVEALEEFKKQVSSHKVKLYKLMYEEGIAEDEEELSQEDLFILFQYRIMSILENCLQETLKNANK